MEIALSSHVEDFVLHFSILLVVLGAVGFLLARKWPRTRWASVPVIIGILAFQARHFIPRPEWAAESRAFVWQMLALLVGAGAAALCLIFLGARGRT
jgi:hypothetical protein